MHLNVITEPRLQCICPFKSPLLYYWCMFIGFHPLRNILIQVGNLNMKTFLSN